MKKILTNSLCKYCENWHCLCHTSLKCREKIITDCEDFTLRTDLLDANCFHCGSCEHYVPYPDSWDLMYCKLDKEEKIYGVCPYIKFTKAVKDFYHISN